MPTIDPLLYSPEQCKNMDKWDRVKRAGAYCIVKKPDMLDCAINRANSHFQKYHRLAHFAKPFKHQQDIANFRFFQNEQKKRTRTQQEVLRAKLKKREDVKTKANSPRKLSNGGGRSKRRARN